MRQGDARLVQLIGVPTIDFIGNIVSASPHAHVTAGIGKHHPERRTPRATAHHRDATHDVLLFHW
jgi:hypothetical protein